MKKILVSLGLIVAMMVGAVVLPMGVYAADDICKDSFEGLPEEQVKEMKAAAGCNDFGAGKRTAVPIALYIINVVLSFVGLIATGVIVYGGILYVTSTGDASKTSKAKNCILYGIVGLIVAIMSFAIVSFVNTSVLKK